MKVLLLCHQDFVPHQKVKNISRADNSLWRTEYYVREALARLGYQVKICAIRNSLQPLKNDLRKFKPDVVFNMVEEFCGEGRLEPFVVSYLESIGQAYSGCGSIGLILAKNKVAAKVILKEAKINVPEDKKYPKIVKLLDEESSRGISETSIVVNKINEARQIKKLRREFDSTAFTEEYIQGRELHIAVIVKSGRRWASPIWETKFGNKKGAKFISEKVKWDFAYRIRTGIELVPAENLKIKLINKIKKTAISSCRALKVSGYARVDIRLTKDNKIYVLEVNPNPDIAFGDEFAECVRSGGMEYDKLIELIVHEALRK